MDLTLYQKMIGTNNSSVTQAYINDTIIHVNDMFEKSPSFRKMQFDGVLTGCIINHKKSNALDILLRPQSEYNVGVYVEYKDDTFILTEFVANEIYPKATLQLCNASIKWKHEDGSIKEYRCIVSGNSYKVADVDTRDKRLVATSEGEIAIYVQYNENTKTIRPNQRFIFGNSAFEVTSIDEVTNVYKNKGILKLDVKYTNATNSDDKINQVADTSGNSGWGAW